MNNLNSSNYKTLANNFMVPKYNLETIKTGIIHFGPGAFHRAHQAFYFDKILNDNPNFGICGISLHSKSVYEKLAPQNFLYSIEIIDKQTQNLIIGSIRNILIAPENPQKVISELANENIKIVSSTITEKGYYIENGKLNLEAQEIAHDLKNLANPKSFFGFICAGLIERYNKKLPPFTILICDNLIQNGKTCKKALLEFIEIAAPQILEYAQNINCPSAMVDSITPASNENAKENFINKAQLIDNWPIIRENFCQWVIEDFPNDFGFDWAKYGIEITNDITQYENAKLKILNGAHSFIAYWGILRGHENVFQAWCDLEIQTHVKKMVFEEIIPLIKADFDLIKYTNDVFERFNNPKINHLLTQIAWDGSKKIPIRIISSIVEAINFNNKFDNLCQALASYLVFIFIRIKTQNKIIDPFALEFGKIFNNSSSDTFFENFINLENIIPIELSKNENFKNVLQQKFYKLIETYSYKD